MDTVRKQSTMLRRCCTTQCHQLQMLRFLESTREALQIESGRRALDIQARSELESSPRSLIALSASHAALHTPAMSRSHSRATSTLGSRRGPLAEVSDQRATVHPIRSFGRSQARTHSTVHQ
jgi:hypothetical protein